MCNKVHFFPLRFFLEPFASVFRSSPGATFPARREKNQRKGPQARRVLRLKINFLNGTRSNEALEGSLLLYEIDFLPPRTDFSIPALFNLSFLLQYIFPSYPHTPIAPLKPVDPPNQTFRGRRSDVSKCDFLYFCTGIWMQDRPVIQHELAQRLARMIHLISEDRAVLFLRAFWQTMLREWNGIDKHRLDKFYALMRYFLNETFALVKSNHWSKDLTQTVMQVLQDFPLNPSPTVVKAGVQFHVLDVFLEELEKIEPQFITQVCYILSLFLQFSNHFPRLQSCHMRC
jgi:hypothetical protein